MLKTILKITALSVATLTLLSACGAANKLEDAADRAQDAADNAADRAENERERLARLTPPPTPAKSVVSIRGTGTYSNAGTYEEDQDGAPLRDDDTFNIDYTKTQDTFTLRQVGANLIMTVNGTDYTFTPAGSNLKGRNWDAVGAGALNAGFAFDDLPAFLDRTHLTIQGDYVSYSTIPNNLDDIKIKDFNIDFTRGYATIGVRTTAPVVTNQTATAVYIGWGEINIRITDYTHETDVADVDGGAGFPLTMTVDFDGNTVSGTGTTSDGGSGTATFGSAPIVGNGFAGTFTIDSDFRTTLGLTSASTGNYSGHFFGPAADDLAGVMRFDGANTSGAVYGQGGFRADRQDPAQ